MFLPDEEYEVEIVDVSEHSEHLFCSDMTCPCHEDQENINILNGHVQAGLASTGDADRIYRGRNI